MDRRNPDCRDADNLYHPWSLGSGDPCRNDALFLNLMAVTQSVGTRTSKRDGVCNPVANVLCKAQGIWARQKTFRTE